jgi:hypothetical protein
VTYDRSVVFSTNKTDRHDIAEILLKLALNTINQTKLHCELSIYIPAAPAYGVYISQLMRYSIACGSTMITLIKDGYKEATEPRVSHHFKDFMVLIMTLLTVTKYVTIDHICVPLSSFVTYHRVCNKSTTMAETSGAGTDVPVESIIYMIGQQLSFKNK